MIIQIPHEILFRGRFWHQMTGLYAFSLLVYLFLNIEIRKGGFMDEATGLSINNVTLKVGFLYPTPLPPPHESLNPPGKLLQLT